LNFHLLRELSKEVEMKKLAVCLICLFSAFTIPLFPIHGKAASPNKNPRYDELRTSIMAEMFDKFAHAGASGIVKERMKIMKSFGRSMKIMNAALRNQSAENNSIIINEVTKMVKETARLPNLFPVGTSGGVSEASPRIWKQPGEFANMISAFTQALRDLATASSLNSQSVLIKSFRKVGAACKGCHQDFREKKRH